jgi:hypothetical protein
MDFRPDETALLARQRALQTEAEEFARDIMLMELAQPLGDPVLVGSAALGLMVWRDLDVTVVCPRLEINAVVEVGSRLALHPRVREVVFRNDTGAWNTNTNPTYPDGLYLGLSYRSPAGDDWKSDIWFVDEPDRQPDLAHLKTLPSRLTAETRLAILRVKSVWASRPEYPRVVRGFDIYRAVLDGGVRTPDEFAAWLAEREEHHVS